MKSDKQDAVNDPTPKSMRFVSPKTVAVYGVLIALTAAVTYSSAAPFSPTKGYFNLGDSMVFFSALAFGWRAGAICGGVGSALADILLGFGIFAPLTLAAKGTEGFVAGGIAGRKSSEGLPIALSIVSGAFVFLAVYTLVFEDMFASSHPVVPAVLSLASAAIAALPIYLISSRGSGRVRTWAPTVSPAMLPVVLSMVAGAFVFLAAYILVFEDFLADSDQPTAALAPSIALAVVAAVAVYIIFTRSSERVRTWTPVVLGVTLGGVCMIVIYFLGEWLLLDVGFGKAILEIPINIAQAVIGGTIGSFLSHRRVKKYYPSLSRGM